MNPLSDRLSTYGSECWAMKVTNKSKIATTEMGMRRGILGVSRRDHIYAKRRKSTHVRPTACIDRRGYAQWPVFVGFAMSKEEMRTTSPQSGGAGNFRRRWRSKMTWHQQIKDVGVTQDVALDRKEWRRRTRPPLGCREKAIKVSKCISSIIPHHSRQFAYFYFVK